MQHNGTHNCSSCNTIPAPGNRWCSSCRIHLADPSIGTLCSPAKRLGAHLLDVVLPLVGAWIWFFIAGAGAMVDSGAVVGLSFIFSTLFSLGYIALVLLLYTKGTSPGKKLLGLYVVRADGQRAKFLTMLLREFIGKMISGMVFSLGFIWVLIDRENQGWHDKLASTYVVDTSRKPQ